MKYKVYMHITPNGKRYIGLTMQKVNVRWQNGNGYRDQDYFYKAINKYGWENIEHKIIAKNLSKEQAIDLEISLIEKYNTTDRSKGYNMTTGGEFCNHHPDTLKKMSESQRLRNIENPLEHVVLSYEIADDIRKDFATRKYTHAELGKKYGVGRGTITCVIKNLRWVDDDYEEPINPTWKKVRKIRKDYATGNYSQRELCKKYDMGKTGIHNIVANKAWVE